MKKVLLVLLVLITAFCLFGCEQNKDVVIDNSSLAENNSSELTSTNIIDDGSPGTIWKSSNQRIIIEYNKNKIHKCYVGKYTEKEEYYLKIDEENKIITFYSSSEMKDSQVVSTEQWTIKSGSFSGEKVKIITSISDIYNDPYKIITLYNKGRNPVNDPDFKFSEAEKIAKNTFKEGNYENIEYKGIEKRGIYDYYAFYAYREPIDSWAHKSQSWVYINVKTGEMEQWVCN